VIATLSLYGLVLLVCLIAGVALQAVLAFGAERWVSARTLPLGACALVVVLYPLSYLGPMDVVGPVVVGALAAIVLVALVIRGLAPAPGGGRVGLAAGAALRPEGADLVVLGLGLAGGVLLLLPVLGIGFPTVLGITNNDGWYYAGLVDWLSHNPAGAELVPALERPLDGSVVMMRGSSLPFGFELLAAAVRSLTTRESFEVVGPVGAAAFPMAVAGWAWLREEVSGPRDGLVGVFAAVAAASPLFVLVVAENYLTQAMGLALVPSALAAGAAFLSRPSWRPLLLAAIAAGAVLGFYVGMVPWFALMLGVLGFAVTGPWPFRRGEPRHALVRRVANAAVLLAILAAATVVVAPIAVYRAVEFTRLASVFSGAGPFASFDTATNLAFLLGGLTVPTLGAGVAAAIGAVLVAAAVALALSAARWPAGRPAGALVAASLLATTIVFARYAGQDYNYGTYKTLISGGALLAGTTAIALAAGWWSRAARFAGWTALAACAAVWIPGVVSLLHDVDHARSGFRAPDIAMGERLRELPDGSTVLVDGIGVDSGIGAFQMRMMAAYFVSTTPELRGEGLWTTPSYISPGPLPQFRPMAPWDYVLSEAPAPVETGRARVWSGGAYRLGRAPEVDVARYGTSWYAPQRDAGGLFQWTTGPSELVVGNRAESRRRVRLSVRLESLEQRTATLTTDDGEVVSVTLVPGRTRKLAIPLVIPARATRVVTLDALPAGRAPGHGDSRPLLLRVSRIRVTPVSGGPVSILPRA
jgi:hypothetical protein